MYSSSGTGLAEGLRLALPDHLLPDGLSNPQFESLEIYVLPAQCQQLANAKASCRIFTDPTRLLRAARELGGLDWPWDRCSPGGVDLWLNTPKRPYEASGTSGMGRPTFQCLARSRPRRWNTSRQTSVNTPSTGVEILTPHWRLIDYPEAVLNLARRWNLSLAGLFWHCECNRAIKTIRELSQFHSRGGTMRSDLVFGAMTHVSNRFLLTRVAAHATRKLHRPNTRIEDTANEVFERFRTANPLAVVSHSTNLQPFPRTAPDEAHPLYEDLEQSVA